MQRGPGRGGERAGPLPADDGRVLRVGSVFSGVEGFGLGLELTGGFQVVWTSEIDSYACRILSARFGVPNLGDVAAIDPEQVDGVDCITFGFPCQDLSVAGHRAGLDGARSGLFWEALVVIAAKRPRWIVAENVPGLWTSAEGVDFGIVLWSLAALGYSVSYAELDAQHHGVPQRRRRIILVGHLGGESRARQVLAVAHGGFRDPPKGGREEHPAAGRAAFGAGDPSIAHTLRSNPRNNSNAGSTPLIWDEPISFDTQQDPVSAVGVKVRQGLAAPPVHPAGDGTPPGVPGWLDLPMWRDAAQSGRLRLDRETNRLHRGQEGGQVGTPSGGGRLGRRRRSMAGGPDEACSDPDDQRGERGARGQCSCPDGPRYACTGNAVPVPVATWLGRRILEVERMSGPVGKLEAKE